LDLVRELDKKNIDLETQIINLKNTVAHYKQKATIAEKKLKEYDNLSDDDNYVEIDPKKKASFHKFVKETIWPKCKYVNKETFIELPDIMILSYEWLGIKDNNEKLAYKKSVQFNVRSKIADLRKHYRLALKKKVFGKLTKFFSNVIICINTFSLNYL
jgi:hypothetical protein